MSISDELLKTVMKTIEGKEVLFIEKEIGAEDGLSWVKDHLKEKTDLEIYEASASKTGDTIFSKAMPRFSNVLKIGNPPNVLTAYYTNMDGMLITEVKRQDSNLDSDIFSGMLTAVNNFVQDSMKQWSGEEGKEGEAGGGLDVLSYKDKNLGNLIIHMGRGENGVLVVTYKGDISSKIKKDIQDTTEWIDDTYGNKLQNWSGKVNEGFIKDIQSFIRDDFFESGKYDGKLDMDSVMDSKEEIVKRLTNILKNKSKKKNIVFLFDDVEHLEPLSIDLIDHTLENLDIPMICQYETDVLDHGVTNEGLKSLIEDIKSSGRLNMYSIKSDINIEDLVRSKLKKVDKEAFNVLKYAAVLEEFDTDILSKAMRIPADKLDDVISNLDDIGVVKNRLFANSRLRERGLERINDKERRMIDLKLASALIKSGKHGYSKKIAELLIPYAENQEKIRKKAVEYSIEAGDQMLKAFNTEKAVDFYNKAISFDSNEDRKQSLLQKTLILESITWK